MEIALEFPIWEEMFILMIATRGTHWLMLFVQEFCVTRKFKKGAATGVGNPVYYVGPGTGRDGLGGASFASRELTEESAEDRPAVQKGDPFMEKLLLEACLEMMSIPGLVVGIQDMGAAGLTCSTCETASRGKCRDRDRSGSWCLNGDRDEFLRNYAF